MPTQRKIATTPFAFRYWHGVCLHSDQHPLVRVLLNAMVGAMLVCCTSNTRLRAQVGFEKPPIDYGKHEVHDPVARLSERLQSGETQLEYSDQHGWLPSLLQELEVPISSQTLVFSKTSLQLHKISPRRPRAIYFNDDVYVGWCQDGDVVELAATDSQQGAVFYTVDQYTKDAPEIRRDRGQCLSCHATHRTQGVPGYLVRSIYADFSGRPRSGTRSFVTDHSTDFSRRFGGWYVTGRHGNLRHMGNVLAQDRSDPEKLNREAGANVEQLNQIVDIEPYLAGGSDLVALMVLEHQTQMHNLIARASFETRIARYYDRGINEALGRPLDRLSPSTVRRIETAAEELVRYMLFADEFPLSSPIRGTSSFAEDFTARAKKLGQIDPEGRSLRELDLETRLLKYPCSHLIYSDAFDALPAAMMQKVRDRLSEVLTSPAAPSGFERLSDQDRTEIVAILNATKPGFLLSAEKDRPGDG